MKDPQSPGPCPEATHQTPVPGLVSVALARLVDFDHHPGLVLLPAQSRLWELTHDLEQASSGNGSDQAGGMRSWEQLHLFSGRCWDHWDLAGNASSWEAWDMGHFAIKSVLGGKGRSLPSLRRAGPHWAAVAVERSLLSTASGVAD